jgi:hypothetical protein
VSESSLAQGNLTDLTVSRLCSERPFGKVIVDAYKAVATRSHGGASYHRGPGSSAARSRRPPVAVPVASASTLAMHHGVG